jgi:hypothetical protein
MKSRYPISNAPEDPQEGSNTQPDGAGGSRPRANSASNRARQMALDADSADQHRLRDTSVMYGRYAFLQRV